MLYSMDCLMIHYPLSDDEYGFNQKQTLCNKNESDNPLDDLTLYSPVVILE